MHQLSDIRILHVEMSSFCNARCPRCIRNDSGTEYNTGFPEHNTTLLEFQQIFPKSFIRQLNTFLISGNLGDMIMNPEVLDIIRWFRQIHPTIRVWTCTNGSGRTSDFWKELAALGVEVTFAIDGLEDTNHLYRQNTSWTTIIKNAKTFIGAGGKATWQFVKFDHNQHQIEQARELSTQMGFVTFYTIINGRGPGHVFTRFGDYSHTIGASGQSKDYQTMVFHRTKTQADLNRNYLLQHQSKPRIDCESKRTRELYMNSVGELYPCCYVGHNPTTLDPVITGATFIGQLKEFMADHKVKNNALQYPLAECIEWFNEIEKTWAIGQVREGRLMICNDSCGVT